MTSALDRLHGLTLPDTRHLAPGRTYGLPIGTDPRPHLPGSELWGALLELASGDADDFGGVYGRLLGARACGAVLELRAGKWKLAPTIDPTGRLSVWASRESWDHDAAKWLRPHSRQIVELLRQLPVPVGLAEALGHEADPDWGPHPDAIPDEDVAMADPGEGRL